jgi:hypothetical protein
MVNQCALRFKLLFVLLAIIAICACGQRREARYKGMLVDDGYKKYCVKPGGNEVFEMHEFKSAGVIPFAYSGYSLLFEIDPALVRVGQAFQIPSDDHIYERRFCCRGYRSHYSGRTLGPFREGYFQK